MSELTFMKKKYLSTLKTRAAFLKLFILKNDLKERLTVGKHEVK